MECIVLPTGLSSHYAHVSIGLLDFQRMIFEQTGLECMQNLELEDVEQLNLQEVNSYCMNSEIRGFEGMDLE